jgi:enoyl-CoA hydratase/carnithine racemase
MVTEAPRLLAELDGHVLTITLNRPDRRNAFTRGMIELWSEALVRARTDEDVHVVVVTGAGEAFCAGVDLAGSSSEGGAKDDPNAIELYPHRVAVAMEDLDKPVIAAVNGAAIGAGLGLALMADLRFFSDRAKASEIYVKAGIFPGSGDTYFLPRIVGASRALKMMWTGDPVLADEALAIGLADEVFSHDDLMPKTLEFARQLAERSQLVVRGIKRAVRASERATLRDSLSLIGAYSRAVTASPERRAAMDAFLAGRSSKDAS